MKRRLLLKAIGLALLPPIVPRRVWASPGFRRRRPADAAWPSHADWKRLDDAVGGNLISVDFPLSVLKSHPQSDAAQRLVKDLRNPYYIGDQAGLTQTLGWVDAWACKPSVYAVAARNARDVAEAVNFARENDLRLVVKGGGHSYQGTSNAPDSLLVWTRRMHDITVHDAFVPQDCEHVTVPQPAVTLGAGTIWMQAYQAATTQAGKYVQGGGCTTVGVAGLIQSGGFGSFSKRYGTAAASLLEAEVVTADGSIRTANACKNPDLFWALKGGGGGSFGVISKVTLQLHDLPDFFGAATFKVQASSDRDFRRLIGEFLNFYSEHLFNPHWGEQAHVNADNSLEIAMVSQGLSTDQANEVWRPFLDWIRRSPKSYSLTSKVIVASWPARHMWDVPWWKTHWPEMALPDSNFLIGVVDRVLAAVTDPIFDFDDRPGATPNNAWWKADAGQVGWFIWGYDSLWLPASLLERGARERFADALFASSRYASVALHFNKGLAGASSEVLAAARNTATNPSVLSAFALAIVADGQGPAYPGIPGFEPSVSEGRKSAARIARCIDGLREVTGSTGAYVSESSYFERDFQHAYWGNNYSRLLEIKNKYDPEGLFFVHNGVGSERWSEDGFARS
jgi:FAD/FMN-containing dehydrogenase